MQYDFKAQHFKTSATVLLASVSIFSATLAQADEAYAIATLDKMSSYLGAQTTLSFDYQATLDIVTTDEQKLSIASSGTVELERPDKLNATRTGGFAAIEIGFDGQTLTALNVDEAVYGQAQVPGTVANLIDTLREKFNRPLPAADILTEDFSALLKPMLTDTKDLGAGVINGTVCDHFAFRTEHVDLQLWIATGDTPFPCRYTITNKQITGWPDYQFDVSNWQTGTAVTMGSLTVPEGATVVAFDAIPHLDDLAGIYSPEGTK